MYELFINKNRWNTLVSVCISNKRQREVKRKSIYITYPRRTPSRNVQYITTVQTKFFTRGPSNGSWNNNPSSCERFYYSLWNNVHSRRAYVSERRKTYLNVRGFNIYLTFCVCNPINTWLIVTLEHNQVFLYTTSWLRKLWLPTRWSRFRFHHMFRRKRWVGDYSGIMQFKCVLELTKRK